MSLKILGYWAVGTFLLWAVGQGGNWNPFAVYQLVWVFGYVISLYIHPRRACTTCGGKGSHYGRVWDYGWRPCRACEGRGWFLRLGSRLLNVSPDGRFQLGRQRGSSSN